jgi:3-phenylpropionate/cinnamic acid dioxygenase small subunit
VEGAGAPVRLTDLAPPNGCHVYDVAMGAGETDTGAGEMGELLARLRRLEDERAILDLIHAYSHGLDGKEYETFMECFTEDGRFAWKPIPEEVFVIDVRGTEQLDGFYRALETRVPGGLEHHALTNPRIVSYDGARARVVSWYVIVRDYGGRPSVRSTGRYLDELVRGDDGRWRIHERLAMGDMPR